MEAYQHNTIRHFILKIGIFYLIIRQILIDNVKRIGNSLRLKKE